MLKHRSAVSCWGRNARQEGGVITRRESVRSSENRMNQRQELAPRSSLGKLCSLSSLIPEACVEQADLLLESIVCAEVGCRREIVRFIHLLAVATCCRWSHAPSALDTNKQKPASDSHNTDLHAQSLLLSDTPIRPALEHQQPPQKSQAALY